LILDIEGIAKKAEFTENVDNSKVSKAKRTSHNEKDIVWIDVERKGEYAIALDEVFRLEEILTSQTECTSKYRVSLYRDKIMPIFSLGNLLTDQDPAQIKFSDSGSMAVIVFETERGFVGFEVSAVKDVRNVHWALNSTVNNSEFLSGSIESDETIIHIIDVNLILAHFGFKSLKEVKLEIKNIAEGKVTKEIDVEKDGVENSVPQVDDAAGWGMF
jgi:hypothetical protein